MGKSFIAYYKYGSFLMESPEDDYLAVEFEIDLEVQQEECHGFHTFTNREIEITGITYFAGKGNHYFLTEDSALDSTAFELFEKKLMQADLSYFLPNFE